jgi:hypothetical protein
MPQVIVNYKDFFSSVFLRFTIVTLFASVLSASSIEAYSQGIEWTEKDLAKNVHRAEEAFKAGKMSRAYGLFAHLVSIAEDRPFLHFRFGSICTYTSGHQDEAEEHLLWAMELNILDTEHAAEWNYYQGRLFHLRYDFDNALVYYRIAIDEGKQNNPWMNDAKLYYGQCMEERPNALELVELSIKSKLASHSEEYFRLYDMAITDGRILDTPESLRSRYDIKNGYNSTMHWLPGKRCAFFSSYGKNGDTALDIYRVTVDGLGEYGEPERLPKPINGDFDDCAPICITSDADNGAPDQLYFSSTRPESYGGLDIFSVTGNFSSGELRKQDETFAHHLPMEINSTSDEWLYYKSESNKSQWISTNRDQDFEGKEVWEFSSDVHRAFPAAVHFDFENTLNKGKLQVKRIGEEDALFTIEGSSTETMDYMVQNGTDLELIWKDQNGIEQWREFLSIPQALTPQIALESISIGNDENGASKLQSKPKTFVSGSALKWTTSAMNAKQSSGVLFEQMSESLANEVREDNREHASIQRIIMAQVDNEFNGNEASYSKIPNWLLGALSEIGTISIEDLPQTVHIIRSQALKLQKNIELIHCWDAPGSDRWALHDAIKRFGEPALGVLSEETRALENETKCNIDHWKDWERKVLRHLGDRDLISQDWLIIEDYINAQVQSNESAYLQVQDMHRRIESHLAYDRWVTEAFPMDAPEFQDQLLRLSANNQALNHAINAAARQTDESDDVLTDSWFIAQEVLWEQLTDSILDVHEYGVYSLPEMKDAQSWFIRSGGLLEDAKEATLPQEQVNRGQAAVGLAWETFSKGASKRDLVKRESNMSAGEWWKHFGSQTEKNTRDYSGFEMFTNNNSTILQQAELYLEELDVIRTKRKSDKDYKSSMASAIAMRSGLELELNALFGGTVVQDLPELNIQPNSAIEDSSIPVMNRVESLTENPDKIIGTTDSTPSTEATISNQFFTIQIGAFEGLPEMNTKWFNQAFSKIEGDGLNHYVIGSFENILDANKILKEIIRDIPDAFIKPVSGLLGEGQSQPIKPAPTSSSNGEMAMKKPQNQYQLKIATIEGDLEPKQTARLLRLGNQIQIQTVRKGSKTLYISAAFDTFKEAEAAFNMCLKKGFSNAEIQIKN